MNILFYILTGLFFSTSVAFAILFKKLKTKYENLLLGFDELKNNILNEKKIGYYCGQINLVSKEEKADGKKGETYYYTVHVEEVDRYTNGMSKLKLLNVEVTYGYDHSQYEWIKETTASKFSTIKLTKDVEWLESLETIKTTRKKKLEEVIKNLK
jgi:hypothetical protein